MYRLIGNIRVSMTKKVYATITDEIHHLVTTELLAIKWGKGLETAKEASKATTQDSISSALLPLTNIYYQYIISQRLRRLACAFYRDALFANNKSIIGNICAQIFTDGEGFIYVNPMESKSQAGEYLNVVTRDIGVPNTLILDYAG